MTANSSIILSNIDFDTHKNTLKQYLKSQTRFQDYDFEGSNMNVLLDVLSYNTYHNMFYLNMVASEMFLDSAQLRDSVVSHAKELNYTPRSFKSAEANVDITITTSDLSKRSIAIAKGQTFTSRFDNRNFTFSTDENIILNNFVVNTNDTLTFAGANIKLCEGYYVNDTYTFNTSDTQRFILSNRNGDVSSVNVIVIEDVGATVLTYTKVSSLFNLNSESQVFFVQAAEDEKYEIVFGDGVTGRKPKDNSVISVEYRISNGQLPNGCNSFVPDTTIDGESAIVITTNSPAASGNISETVEQIRHNAPRHFTTQERAITTEDYENILRQNFSEINAVTAFGGEDLDPPQFGKVFVAVDLVNVDGLPQSKRDEYFRFLKPRSPVSIEPVFVEPGHTYIEVNVIVNYDINVTRLSTEDIKAIVATAIRNFSQANLDNFNRVFRYSNLVNAIDSAQAAIISNETTIRVVKEITPTLGVDNTFDVEFQIPLDTSAVVSRGGFTIQSSPFTFKGNKASLRDDGNGVINIISTRGESIIEQVGTVDYNTGLVQISRFNITAFEGPDLQIRAIPLNRDIRVLNNIILSIEDPYIIITVNSSRDNTTSTTSTTSRDGVTSTRAVTAISGSETVTRRYS